MNPQKFKIMVITTFGSGLVGAGLMLLMIMTGDISNKAQGTIERFTPLLYGFCGGVVLGALLGYALGTILTMKLIRPKRDFERITPESSTSNSVETDSASLEVVEDEIIEAPKEQNSVNNSGANPPTIAPPSSQA